VAGVRLADAVQYYVYTDSLGALHQQIGLLYAILSEDGGYDGKIHLIFGKFYQFIGAETTQDPRDLAKYTITYEWELDEGTPIPPGATVIQIPGEQSIEAVVLPEPANGETSPTLWRYPFSVPYLYQFDPKERPLYIPFFPYAIEPDGWRTLPGLVDL